MFTECMQQLLHLYESMHHQQVQSLGLLNLLQPFHQLHISDLMYILKAQDPVALLLSYGQIGC